MTAAPTPARLRRLREELDEAGVTLAGEPAWREVVLEEIDHALRPPVHERRVASLGTIVEPTTDPSGWEDPTALTIVRRPIGEMSSADARKFADGLSSFLVRRLGAGDEWAIFDRPAGSERDLVVLAEVLGATVVQRHPMGAVRVAGSFGVLRSEGIGWHHEPPLATWIDAVTACGARGSRDVLETLLEFAVHDLGSRGIGATLLYQPVGPAASGVELRLPVPPPLQITRPSDLAPLRHALAQVDGATAFDASGTLRQLGVRLVPSADAETSVEGLRGMRHTAGRRYSFDDPSTTVIVVSEDGPVTVLRHGSVLGRSPAPRT